MQQVGLDCAFVERQRKVGGNGKGTGCTDNMSSLLRMDIGDVRIKDEFTVPDESRIFEFADLFTVLPRMEMGFNPGFG